MDEETRERLKEEARQLLDKKGFIVDGMFEGDFIQWVGAYARPKDKPTYLDPADEAEAMLQDKYSVNGFKQDFSEWFEWKVVNGQLEEM
ncbi:hypothetical protein ACYSNR_09200 [Enterococcus sp. LJL128]